VIYQTLDEPLGNDELKGRFDIPQTLEEFMIKMKEGGYDAKTFAVKLREMVLISSYFKLDEIIVVRFLHFFKLKYRITKNEHLLGDPYGTKD
jgi:alpha-1,4-galacturonosyltransferase